MVTVCFYCRSYGMKWEGQEEDTGASVLHELDL